MTFCASHIEDKSSMYGPLLTFNPNIFLYCLVLSLSLGSATFLQKCFCVDLNHNEIIVRNFSFREMIQRSEFRNKHDTDEPPFQGEVSIDDMLPVYYANQILVQN